MSLNRIVSSVQLICEAIASVVNIDVTIVDDQRVRLAGTGRYKDSVGEVVSENAAFSYALREGHGFIIENPGEHQACMNCDCKDKCTEHAEVCCPIHLDGKTIGVIGLIAFKESQRKALLNNQKNLMAFLDRMADLIASKLAEQENHDAVDMLAKELEVVIDSLDTNLIAVGTDGHILRTNHRFRKTFGSEIKHIKALLGEKKSLLTLSQTENSKNHYHTFQNGTQGVYDVSVIKINRAIRGYILTIKTMEEVMNTLNEVMLDGVVTGFEQIIGTSDALIQAKALARRVASSQSTVLILGESGTGKELFARAIHSSSSRQGEPFVAVNCAAIPDYLLESELFGYDEGAFTGAKRGGKLGKFQLANRGTLFLDEIGDMPLHLQAKLLRAIQEKVIDRLGGDVSVPVDVRVIAATHANLEEKVLEGSFRQDLYYRLNVIPIILPPLRNRKEDLLLTADLLTKKWCEQLEKRRMVLSEEAKQLLMVHDWPGNVRELENTIEYAVHVCDDIEIKAYHLPKRLQNLPLGMENRSKLNGDIEVSAGVQPEALISLEEAERHLIALALKHYGDSGEGLEKAAVALGISRATLYRKIKLYSHQL
jgi:sigma-54 dependent transcriptional regulator, acetoin dehydrogenase operon transcriptional activator AcoR